MRHLVVTHLGATATQKITVSRHRERRIKVGQSFFLHSQPHFKMNADYFPPTLVHSVDYTSMAETAPSTNGTHHTANNDATLAQANGSLPTYSAPSRVTLHLGHLPSKKDIKAPWPRTPSRVGINMSCNPRSPSDVHRGIFYQVDPNNPPWPAYRGYHEYSFAHATMGVRLPTILGKAIDDASRTLNEQYAEDKIVDLAECLERMDALMADLSGNAKLRPIIDDGEGDVALWNKEIAKFFQGMMFAISTTRLG